MIRVEPESPLIKNKKAYSYILKVNSRQQNPLNCGFMKVDDDTARCNIWGEAAGNHTSKIASKSEAAMETNFVVVVQIGF